MTNELATRRLLAALQAGATGRQLTIDGAFVLPTSTVDPEDEILAPPDGLTVAWTDSLGLAFHSTYYATLGGWRTVQLT